MKRFMRSMAVLSAGALLIAVLLSAARSKAMENRAKGLKDEQDRIGVRLKERAVELGYTEQNAESYPTVINDEEMTKLHERRVEISYELDRLKEQDR